MPNYEVRRLRRDDLDLVVGNTHESALWALMDEARIAALLDAESWVGLVDEQIVACGGIVPIWPGLAEAWIAVTPLAQQHVHFLYRHVLSFLDVVITSYALRRIEAHVNASFHRAVIFAERLGFRIDAPLPKYGPNGETFYLMSRVT